MRFGGHQPVLPSVSLIRCARAFPCSASWVTVALTSSLCALRDLRSQLGALERRRTRSPRTSTGTTGRPRWSRRSWTCSGPRCSVRLRLPGCLLGCHACARCIPFPCILCCARPAHPALRALVRGGGRDVRADPGRRARAGGPLRQARGRAGGGARQGRCGAGARPWAACGPGLLT